MRERLVGLGACPTRRPASSSTARRSPGSTWPRTRAGRSGRTVGCGSSTPGPLTPTYELDVAVAAVARIDADRPDLDVTLEIYGRGDSEPALRAQAAELGVADRVTFHGRIPIDDGAGRGRRARTSASRRRATTRSPT